MTKAERALEEIMQCERVLLTPAQVAPVLGCDPYSINVQAQKDATKLGFPVVVIGSRVKIPRLPFLQYLSGVQSVNVMEGGGGECG